MKFTRLPEVERPKDYPDPYRDIPRATKNVPAVEDGGYDRPVRPRSWRDTPEALVNT